MTNKLIVFEDKKIRRTWHNDEWFYSVIDIVAVLEVSSIPKRYWSDLKIKLKEEGFEVYDLTVRLKLSAEDGKLRETDCANTKAIFRIIQSIPSKRAEPFKLWLAQLGQERIDEIENPELAQELTKRSASDSLEKFSGTLTDAKVCLNSHLVIVLDKGFKDNGQLKTNAVQTLGKNSDEEYILRSI